MAYKYNPSNPCCGKPVTTRDVHDGIINGLSNPITHQPVTSTRRGAAAGATVWSFLNQVQVNDIAVHRATGNCYFATGIQNNAGVGIVKTDGSGNVKWPLPNGTTGIPDLAVAVDAAENIYRMDNLHQTGPTAGVYSGSYTLARLRPSDGSVMWSVSPAFSVASLPANGVKLHVDRSANLYVFGPLSTGTQVWGVRKFNAATGAEIIGGGFPIQHGNRTNNGFVAKSGNIYLAGMPSTTNGASLRKFAPDGTEDTSHEWPYIGSACTALCVDANENVFAGFTDSQTSPTISRIIGFTSAGHTKWSNALNAAQQMPQAAACDSSGVYFTFYDSTNSFAVGGAISRYNSATGSLVWTQHGTGWNPQKLSRTFAQDIGFLGIDTMDGRVGAFG